MRDSIQEVLDGEYDCGLIGERLTIADIGANVGAFSIWANTRWSGSEITAYEPHPGTFRLLKRNVAAYDNIRTVNAAVFPTEEKLVPFHARYSGDGEAGVACCSQQTFADLSDENVFEAAALHPRDLPRYDVVKVDTEGSELEILRDLDLSGTSLILLEFQNDSNRLAIKDMLQADFRLLHEDAFQWDPILSGGYRPDLAGDHYGHLFFAARAGCKLRPSATKREALPSWRAIAGQIARKLGVR